MASEFRCHRTVEFADTDMAGIVHFANYFRYMEIAEHEFFRSLGLSVHTEVNGCVISWPRVHAECRFEAPLKFEDELEVRLVVRQKTKKTITYDFQFVRQDGATVGRGSVTTICVAIDPVSKRMSAISIPSCIGERIEAAPGDAAEP